MYVITTVPMVLTFNNQSLGYNFEQESPYGPIFYTYRFFCPQKVSQLTEDRHELRVEISIFEVEYHILDHVPISGSLKFSLKLFLPL